MHIPDGILPPAVSFLGYGLTGLTTWYCLRQIDRESHPQEQIPKAALLAGAFFISSLIHIPLPPVSIHLILNGLIGILLGYYAFLAILIGLFFQAVMFGHGGLTSLGVNALLMGIPSLLMGLGYRWLQQTQPRFLRRGHSWLAFLLGAGALALSAIAFTLLILSFISPDVDPQAERAYLYLTLGGYFLQALIEGTFTVLILAFLQKVKPELLKD
jgi:cobalt/nickel transport system permease protein